MKNYYSISKLLLHRLRVLLHAAANTASAASLARDLPTSTAERPIDSRGGSKRRLAALEAKPQARGLSICRNCPLSVRSYSDVGTLWSPDLEIDSNGTDPAQPPDPGDGNVQRPTRLSGGFSLTQTVSSGGISWSVCEQADTRPSLRAEARSRSRHSRILIIRVAQRYFDVLAAEDRLTSINADRRAIARRLEQAKQRFDVGLDRNYRRAGVTGCI